MIAGIFTVVAVPVLLAARDDGASGSASATTRSSGAGPEPTRMKLVPPTRPDYLNIETVSSDGAVKVNAAPKPSGNLLEATAAYKRLGLDTPSACTTPFAPFGARLTVRNVDNNLTTVCTNVSTKANQSTTIVLDQPVFQRLADLVESPIPVEISWK